MTRYNPSQVATYTMIQHPQGEYVEHAALDAQININIFLREECDRLRAELQEVRNVVNRALGGLNQASK